MGGQKDSNPNIATHMKINIDLGAGGVLSIPLQSVRVRIYCPCTVPGSGLLRSILGNQGGDCGEPRLFVAPRVSSVAWRCATKSDGASDAMKDEKHAGKKFV